MEIERSLSPNGSSAASTASCSRFIHIFRKAPKQPEGDDPKKWAKFLAAYQKGEWENTSDSTKACSKKAQKVKVEGGKEIDNLDFFSRFKYLAAPPLPKEKSNVRKETLLRHGFTGPQVRPSVNRYVRHAKSVFKCDYVSVSVAASDEKSTLFLASEGSACAHMIATNTVMCGHAMLLGEDEMFVVPNLEEDWRFKHLIKDGEYKGHGMHFYASAPILLTAQVESDEDQVPVHVGRLTIMRKEPWKDFGDTEAEILLDIARMTQETLENEYLQSYTKKVQMMQREAAKLSYKLNMMLDSEVFSQETAQGDRMGLLFNSSCMQVVIDVLREQVGASNVAAIDASNLHLMSAARSSSYSSSSPRASTNYGASPAGYTWMSRSTSTTFSPLQEPMSPLLGAASLTPSSEDDGQSNATSVESGSPTQRKTPRSTRQHYRSNSSMFSYGNDEEMYNTDPLTPLRIICSSGDETQLPQVSNPSQCSAVCGLFTELKRKGLYTKPQWYDLTIDVDSDDEEEQAPNTVKNTLGPILPAQAKSCVAIPVFSNDRTHPLSLIVATWDTPKSLLNAERYFCYTIGVMLGGMAFRQQASIADRAQLDFIRSVQHELRTPLNGILGITDFLRQSLVNDSDAEKLDLTSDGLLANLLESIRLSGVNLSTILDDVLDFGAVTGLAHSQKPRATQIEEVDLEREVEDVCLDEIEHISMRERQDRHMRSGQSIGVFNVPTLIVRVSPEVQSRFRTDRSKLRKILTKFVNNALRYTDESGFVEVIIQASRRRDSITGVNNSTGIQIGTDRWVDIIIKDNGVGMSKEFLANSLLKPFSKADSFSQGVGLGVTIAASLISQLGGGFNVQSELGKGTHVQVSLPLGLAAPLRHPAPRRSSTLAAAKPYQVKTAAFYGFEGEGQIAIADLIRERLTQNDVHIVDVSQSPELLILQEACLYRLGDDNQTMIDTPASALPRASGPKARTLVVTRTALRSRASSAIDGQTVWFFRPPFGRGSLELMDEFLREDSPVVLKRIPTPSHTAKNILDKVRERRHTDASTHPPSQDKSITLDNKRNRDEPVAQATSSWDEVESLTNSVKSATTAVSSAPPLESPGIASKQLPIHDVLPEKGVQVVQTVQSNTPISKQASDVTVEETAKQLKPFRILVVEDNPVNMKLITTLLKREKYFFVEAKDGVEAVEQYKAFEPAVVLLDISLPLLDGFGACIQMRAHSLEHIPKIIAITALSSTDDKVRGLEECGMDDWRTKPLSIKTLRTDLVAWQRDWEEAWHGENENQNIEINSVPVTA
ncbi:hypothetical protein L7F22_009666 [Adiantum nelumboides]|nr:hypothetical protein [Adiantum nelumboides]